MIPDIKPTARLVGERAEYPRPPSTCSGWMCSPSAVWSTTRRSQTTTRSSRPGPTTHPVDKMNDDDRRVYDLVVRRFLAVFHPEAVFENTRVETTWPSTSSAPAAR